MSPSHWRQRVQQENELLQQLQTQTLQSLRRRAAALRDGVAELGSIEAVAQAIGISRPAVSKTINKYRSAATDRTTTP